MTSCTVYKPPCVLPDGLFVDARMPVVFLAGSIEMGKAVDWQTATAHAFAASGVACSLLNPRRDSWDASWAQDISNPEFRAQVEWELEAQERAHVIMMNFCAGTQSPITLLELGLFARTNKLIVCCPDGFWRRGNVQVVCAHYNVPLVDSLDALIALAKQRVQQVAENA